MGKQWKQCQTLFFWAPKSLQMVTEAMKLEDAYSLERKLWPTYMAYSKAEALLCQQRSIWLWSIMAMVFPVVMYGCESSTIKKAERWRWYVWTVVLEKTLESPLDCNVIQPVHPKGNQSWIFTGRIDTEAEAPILCPPDAKSWLTGKELMLGKTEGKRRWGQENKMVR